MTTNKEARIAAIKARMGKLAPEKNHGILAKLARELRKLEEQK